MKKIWILSLLWICLLFTGCFNNRQDLPKNPIVFNETEIDWNWAIENDWKYYLAYSTIKPKWVIWDFNYAFWDCLWYVWDDKNDRIYELNGESADEWLIKYYVNGEMEMPMVLREISISNESYTPESVEEPEKDIRFPDSNPIYWWVWTHEIVGDKTIYYNSWYWISFRLWEEFSWGRIVERDTEEWDTINENLYNLHRIEVYKKDWWWEWYGQVFIINVVNNEQSKIWEREHVIWNNNKYSFYSTNLKNWIVDITNERVTDIYIFDVKPEKDRYLIGPESPIETEITSPENEAYRFYIRESSEKDNIYITVNTANLTQDQKYLAENYKLKTNDPSRKILVLNVWKEPVDRNTFKPFWDVSEEYIAKLPEWEKEEYLCRLPWKDNKNLYLENCDFSVRNSELPWYIMFGTLWIQAVDWFIWYSDWYLVSFPYKFPVDAKTFVEGGLRDKVQNNWLQYHHYIWSDKNYFYTREDYDTIVIKRTPKSWDFKLLGTGEYWKYVYDKKTWLEDVSSEFSYDEFEEWNYVMGEQYPPVYKSWNYLYIAPGLWWEYNYWIWRFPVDIETLKEEKFKDTHPINEYITTYYVLSDKDYYYQIIENENWYRVFNRIKK